MKPARGTTAILGARGEESQTASPMVRGPQHILQALKRCGIRLVAYVPDSWLTPLLDAIESDLDIIAVGATREEEALAICCGALFTKTKSALVVQNAGLLSSGAGVVTLLTRYQLPLLMLISHRGSLEDPNISHIPKGRAIEPVLAALGIPFSVAFPREELTRRIELASAYAEASSFPYALLLGREDLLGA